MVREGGEEEKGGQNRDEERREVWKRLKREILELEEEGEWILDEDRLENDVGMDEEGHKEGDEVRDEVVVDEDDTREGVEDESVTGDSGRRVGVKEGMDDVVGDDEEVYVQED